MDTDKILFDMGNRDPNQLNEDKKLQFSDIIGEPDGSHSSEFVWIYTHKIYAYIYKWNYACLTVFCAFPIAFLWAIHFSCLNFWHIWTVTPCARSLQANFDTASRCFSAGVHCCYDPCYEAMGLLFSRIQLNINNSNVSHRPETYLGLTLFSKDEQQRLGMMNKKALENV